MKNDVLFRAGTVIELSFATVTQGKEDQVFNEYFPRVMPIVAGLGGEPLGSFEIVRSDSKLGSPQMGALFQWPTLEAFQQLHSDPRFLAIKNIRDDAMAYFTNGHFFTVRKDTQVSFQKDQLYALKAHWNGNETTASRLNLEPLATDRDHAYAPRNLVISEFHDTSPSRAGSTQSHTGNHESFRTDTYVFKFNISE